MPQVTNCTFFDNAGSSGGGLVVAGECDAVIANTIVWGNAPDGLEIGTGGASARILHSNLQGFPARGGNISADPLFVDPRTGDLRLSPGSPSIDSGNNALVPRGVETDFAGDPRVVDDQASPDCPQAPGACGAPPVVDMGALEFQPCPFDLDGDGAVGVADLLEVLSSWGSDPGGPPDFDGDGTVGITDLVALLARWGRCA